MMGCYFLRRETKATREKLHSATEQELEDAYADCFCCIGHYPEDPDEVEIAFDLKTRIDRERIARQSFFGDHQ